MASADHVTGVPPAFVVFSGRALVDQEVVEEKADGNDANGVPELELVAIHDPIRSGLVRHKKSFSCPASRILFRETVCALRPESRRGLCLCGLVVTGLCCLVSTHQRIPFRLMFGFQLLFRRLDVGGIVAIVA